LQIDGKYYPETMAKHFIINAPWIFTGVWAMIKPWLDPVTAGKIKVIGSNYQDTLFEVVHPNQIPKEFGGTSEMVLDSALTADGEAEKRVDAMFSHHHSMMLAATATVTATATAAQDDTAAYSVELEAETATTTVRVCEKKEEKEEIKVDYQPGVVQIEDVVVDEDGHKTISC
jgi:hypothetical protein